MKLKNDIVGVFDEGELYVIGDPKDAKIISLINERNELEDRLALLESAFVDLLYQNHRLLKGKY